MVGPVRVRPRGEFETCHNDFRKRMAGTAEGRYPAYITWKRFQKNVVQLAENRSAKQSRARFAKDELCWPAC